MFDFGGLSLQQAWYMTPNIAHKVVQIMVVSNMAGVSFFSVYKFQYYFVTIIYYISNKYNNTMTPQIRRESNGGFPLL